MFRLRTLKLIRLQPHERKLKMKRLYRSKTERPRPKKSQAARGAVDMDDDIFWLVTSIRNLSGRFNKDFLNIPISTQTRDKLLGILSRKLVPQALSAVREIIKGASDS
jgi:hypothetical protein